MRTNRALSPWLSWKAAKALWWTGPLSWNGLPRLNKTVTQHDLNWSG